VSLEESRLQARRYHPLALSQAAHRQHRPLGAVGGKGFEKAKIITHMKSFIITFLLAIVAMAGQAKDIIWKNPSAFMGNYNGEFFITQV
jgi:hypothetical protein